ncbi:hypothetical protein GCM10009098_24900 [Rheinheimera aquimaris]|uniref:Uncharacterized protein n=1 Tax=Rheinheimera aquimaris TaxID=412437 RepID=A0ABP3NXR0_9GAMM|nr:hypothetical protein [Rheinheimera aquimaris]MCB5214906.1 hypothetical protein [Rheinheimera aquimaris]
MTIMHIAINVIFALQLALLSVVLPRRCQQHKRQPDKRLLQLGFTWINRLVLLAGSALLLAQITGWIVFNLAILLAFTGLQVLLLLAQRQWLQPAPILPTQRKASLQRRRVLDYVSPAVRVMSVSAVLVVPLLASALAFSGQWPMAMAKLWQLSAVGLLTNAILFFAVYFTVFRKRQNFNDVDNQTTLIQRKVSQYLRAILSFNMLLVLILLLGAFQTTPELLYILLSLSLQLMLLKTGQRVSAGKLAY